MDNLVNNSTQLESSLRHIHRISFLMVLHIGCIYHYTGSRSSLGQQNNYAGIGLYTFEFGLVANILAYTCYRWYLWVRSKLSKTDDKINIYWRSYLGKLMGDMLWNIIQKFIDYLHKFQLRMSLHYKPSIDC